MYRPLKLKLKGAAPIMLHNGQLADPLNKWTKALKKITSKRQKTEADHEEMGKLEFFGGLYVNSEGKIIIPGEVLEGVLAKTATRKKQGKLFRAGIICKDALLKFPGPDDPEELWKKHRDIHVSRMGVVVQRNKVMRTRPIFPEWSITLELEFDDEIIKSEEDVLDIVNLAGRYNGIGEWGPKYGRFTIEK